MNERELRSAVRCIQKLAGPAESSGPTDTQLLERYVAQRDEAAFELLLWRHGAMVLKVCRRVLRDECDAEDAFQATFLAFIRKAPTIVRREAIASWLYKVAFRVALTLKAKTQRIAQHEKIAQYTPAMRHFAESTWLDLRPLLDEAIRGLPQRLRLPFVLCYLEGKTNEEAARQIGCPVGTIFSRLARGRELLRARLVRRGVVLSTSALVGLLSREAASGAPASRLVVSTCQAALRFADRGETATAASSRAVDLAEGVLKAMFHAKIRVVTALLLTLGIVATGGILTREALMAEPGQVSGVARSGEPPAKAKEAPDQKQAPKLVQVTSPKPGGLKLTTSGTSVVGPFEQAEIFAAVSGVLKAQTVDIGSHVKKGQVLAEIDAPLLVLDARQASAAVGEAQEMVREADSRIVGAEADLQGSKAVVQQRQADVDSAKANAQVAQAAYERLKRLQGDKSAAGGEDIARLRGAVEVVQAQIAAAIAALESAKADMQIKQSKVAQAKATLRTMQIKVQAAEITLEKAQYMVGLTRIVAPFDGVITKRNHGNGQYIRTGEQGRNLPLLTLDETDKVRVMVDIPEQDVPFVKPGAPVDLNLSALPLAKLTGYHVSRIGFGIDRKTGTMRAEIDVPNPNQELRPGMFGTVTIHFQKDPSRAMRLPHSSLVHPAQKYNTAVYVVRGDFAYLTPVQGEASSSSEVEIASGLKSTDRVVVDPKGLTGEVVPIRVANEKGSE